MKHLHAILTTNCNLRCPHCGVPDNVEIYNEEKVLEEIKNFDGEVTLFGGECTLYEDRFIKALETKKCPFCIHQYDGYLWKTIGIISRKRICNIVEPGTIHTRTISNMVA